MAAKFWSNVGVAIQSALAVADTITGITKANPGVVTSVGHGWNDGDYILLAVQGMHQLDGRVARVANKTADTAELEGIDTTLFDTFVSGSAQVITFGTTLASAVGVNVSGGEWEFADTTTIHDNIRKQVPTVASPLTFAFDCLWDPADAALTAFKTASDNKATRAVRITFSDGTKVLFNGYVGASLMPTGGAQESVKTNVTLTAFGRPTAYAT